jgi:membrane protease YdiL (CAAX protease family)
MSGRFTILWVMKNNFMTLAEIIFIFATSIALLILAFFRQKIDWQKLGFAPKSLLGGWWQVLIFNLVIFTLVQITIASKFINLPNWVLDKDPILPLLAIVFLQEVLFRGLLINWLEKWGKQKALWFSVLIFVMFHLIAPYTWSSTGLIFACLTFTAGYIWGWHFLKFRNIYILTASHLLVNLSFNYMFFNIF